MAHRKQKQPRQHQGLTLCFGQVHSQCLLQQHLQAGYLLIYLFIIQSYTGYKYSGDTWTKLVPIGNTESCNGYYVMNNVTVRRRSFCLHTFSIFVRIKCLWFSWSACIFVITLWRGLCPLPRLHSYHFLMLNLIFLNIKFYSANPCIRI